MFELLALLVVLAVAGMAIAATVWVVKMVFSLVMLPLKILFFPIVAIFFMVKVAVVAAVGAALVAAFVAVVVPLLVVGLVLAVPIALIALLT